MIHLDYKDGRTIHEQIEAGIKDLIMNGILKPDEQLPSVRELSVSLTVNPNTVQRAYKQLELDGFIYSVKAKGSFVASLRDVQNPGRREALLQELSVTVRELLYLGTDREDIEHIINTIYEKKEGQS
ncbi:MAG: GntR family transcriptional regulator [Clostridia bacterium]|nr:GntR family transcriptional regulator [Clostridia bacterium]